MKHSYFLGIDGGGTKCKARLEDPAGNLLGEYISGPANPMRNYELAMESIQDAIKGVFANANLEAVCTANTHAVIGLAGLNIPSCLVQMNEWQHPFASLQFTTDLHIACVGAHGREAGAIVIVGTGSSGILCKGTQQFEYGGHGFMLGDKGSGAWFGVQTIRYALEVIDGVQTTGEFAGKLLETLNCSSAHEIVEQYANASPAQLAQLAPLLFDYADKNDTNAVKIVKEGANYISELCRQILQQKPPAICLIGGLSHKLIPWLSPDIKAKVSSPLHSPELGAILIARKHQALGAKLA